MDRSHPKALKQGSSRSDLSRPKKLLFALIPAAALFLLAEGVLRLADLERPAPIRFQYVEPLQEMARQSESIFREHPELFWELRPGFPDVVGRDAPNEHTFRGPAYEREKPDTTFRVAVMGDSCTYGVQLSLDQTYARRLESFLSRAHRDRRIEVLNGGVHGYSIFQGRVALERKVLPFEPNVVVLYFGAFNDGKFALGASDLERARARGEHESSSWTARVRGTLDDLHLYRALGAGIDWALSALKDAPSHQDLGRAWSSGKPIYGLRVPEDEFEMLLREMLDLCEARQALPIIILPELNRDHIEKETPAKWGGRQWHHLEVYRGILARVAAERDVLTLDQRRLYAPFEDSRQIYCPNDPVHPDAQGNLILAWALFEMIESLGAIDRVPPSDPAPRLRALDCDVARLTPDDRRIVFRLDAGEDFGGAAYRLVASARTVRWGWQPAELGFPLEIDAIARYVLERPGLAAGTGWLGRLDGEGRAIIDAELPERLFAHRDHTSGFLGFAFIASHDNPAVHNLRPGRDMVSNDVWLAVEGPWN